MIIYKTLNLVNNKIYVGQHYTSADDGYLGSGKILKLAIFKYGKHNFKREILEFVDITNIDDREIYWIAELSATTKYGNYNINIGGNNMTGENNPNFNNKWNDKQKKHLSDIRKKSGFWKGENNPMYKNGNKIKGDKNPSKRKEVREKISKFWKGRKRSEEQCRKQSERMKGNILLDETKKKIGLKSKGHTYSRKFSYTLINTIDGVIYDNVYDLKGFCVKYGLHYDSVRRLERNDRYKNWLIYRERLKNEI